MTTAYGSISDDQFACLAIEMATGVGSVAACVGGQISSREYPAAPMQSREIYAGVQEVLDDLQLELTALHCIAFGCGPGGFTGLRVAAAAAQAMAYGVGVPVARVSSLAALAIAAQRKHDVDCVAACFDARMSEAYLGVYRGGTSSDRCVVVPDCLVAPAHFRLSLEDQFFAAGPGWSACPDLMDNHVAQIAGTDVALVPSATDILVLAAEQFGDGRTVAAAQAVPNYIRDKVTG